MQTSSAILLCNKLANLRMKFLLYKKAFDFCISTIKELDVDLYKKYQEKQQTNDKTLLLSNIEIFKDIEYGINTGYLKDVPNLMNMNFLNVCQ